MILRKPYALLIKHFKKIHLILCLLIIYVAYESNHILTFFNSLISTGTFIRTSFSLPSTYINIYMFLLSIIISIIALIIYILMRQKKKPRLLYLIIIGFYLGLIIFFFQVYNTLGVIEISVISPRSLRVIRDITSVICYIQYAIVLLIAIRAVGFNIKKFNFGEDLAELEIDVSDNEEFELTVGIDADKLRRHIRRGRRELKYFIIENFFVLSIISSIIIVSVSVALFLNIKVYNKTFNQNEPFKANYFINTVNSTYFTHLNQRGVAIAPRGKMFAITSVTFNNEDLYPHKLSLDAINLTAGSNIFSPIITSYQSFTDLGVGYTNQTIAAGTTSTFIFVFQVDENTNFNDLTFRYRESIKYGATRLEAKYKRVKLNGVSVDIMNKISETTIGNELSFAGSPLNNTKLKVNDIQIRDTFTYEANSCFDNNCITFEGILTNPYTVTQKTLLKLSFEYSKDTSTIVQNANILDALINTHGFIRYTVNNKSYDSELINKTPPNYKGKDLYYQVPSSLKDATTINLIFHIRNKEFVYRLK